MSIFLHLHEIAAMRGEGLRPKLVGALQTAYSENEVITLAAVRSKVVFEAAGSLEVEQSSDRKHCAHAK